MRNAAAIDEKAGQRSAFVDGSRARTRRAQSEIHIRFVVAVFPEIAGPDAAIGIDIIAGRVALLADALRDAIERHAIFHVGFDRAVGVAQELGADSKVRIGGKAVDRALVADGARLGSDARSAVVE